MSELAGYIARNTIFFSFMMQQRISQPWQLAQKLEIAKLTFTAVTDISRTHRTLICALV